MVWGVGAAPGRHAGPQFRRFDTDYYFIYTDLGPADAAEAVVRLRRLGDELRRQTREIGFTGRIRQRLPVYLFKHRADYLATGAPPESAGAFLGDRLVAAATDRAGNPAWHVIQHEAFHQFAHAVDGPDLPGWVNEGLGEYFGEALFTGDGYVTGAIPEWRAARVKKSIEDGTSKPLAELLAMSQDEWNRKVVLANYDQAWSVVHYILETHGEGRLHLADLIKGLAAGETSAEAVAKRFGGLKAFEQDWRRHWLEWPEDERGTLKQRIAAVATITSFLARAAAQKHRYASVEEFLASARAGNLPMPPDDWLPPWMLEAAARSLPPQTTWTLQYGGDVTSLYATLKRKEWGETISGQFTLRDGKVADVTAAYMPH